MVLTRFAQPFTIRANVCFVCERDQIMKENSEVRKKMIYPDLYEPIEKFGEKSFAINSGNTVFQVEMHYDPKGRVSVMKQFQDYLLKMESERKTA